MSTIMKGEPLPRLLFMTVTELDEDGLLVRKEHVDQKPDIDGPVTFSKIIPGQPGSSTDFMGGDGDSRKRNTDGPAAPSSRDMMPPPPVPSKRLRIDDPAVDAKPLDESYLDTQDEDDVLADMAGFNFSDTCSQDPEGITTLFSSQSDAVVPDSSGTDLELELLALLNSDVDDEAGVTSD